MKKERKNNISLVFLAFFYFSFFLCCFPKVLLNFFVFFFIFIFSSSFLQVPARILLLAGLWLPVAIGALVAIAALMDSLGLVVTGALGSAVRW